MALSGAEGSFATLRMTKGCRSPSRRAAEPPSRRAAEPPSRRAAELPLPRIQHILRDTPLRRLELEERTRIARRENGDHDRPRRGVHDPDVVPEDRRPVACLVAEGHAIAHALRKAGGV